MSVSPDQIAQGMLATLAVTCPGLSCELGTPERKIIDAVAQAISAAYVSNYLTGSLLDIETKSGLELDQFVGIFGFGRMQGKAAEGVVTIELTTPLNQNFDIQAGTQFYTKTGLGAGTVPLYFSATQHVILTSGTYSVDVPVKCTTVGVSGNVPPDSITFMGSMLGSSSCTNLQSMTGGVDVETDDELRHRFENTLLRNVSGTADWYKALCLQNNSVSRVEVFGPTNTYRTQVQANGTTTSNGTQTISITDVSGNPVIKYTWPGMESVFSRLGQSDETFYSSPNDYELSSGSTSYPIFTRKLGNVAQGTGGKIDVGQIVDVEFQYTSNCSRNDPVNGITNKIDIFVDGSSPFTIAEATVVGSDTFVNDTTSPFYKNNFERIGVTSNKVPVQGNRFTRLNSCPIINFPSSITYGTSVFTRNTHYWLVKDTTVRRGSPYELSGIEWASSGPSSGSPLTLNYVYNQTPEVLTAVMASSKQICTDVMVHQADYRYIMPCLSIQYSHTYEIGTVNTAINERLKSYFQNLNFGSWIDLSSMCLAVQQVLGVASVSVTTQSEDASNYGVRIYSSSNDTTYVTKTENFRLADNQLAQFMSVNINRKPTP